MIREEKSHSKFEKFCQAIKKFVETLEAHKEDEIKFEGLERQICIYDLIGIFKWVDAYLN